jgi:hypothetical protein
VNKNRLLKYFYISGIFLFSLHQSLCAPPAGDIGSDNQQNRFTVPQTLSNGKEIKSLAGLEAGFSIENPNARGLFRSYYGVGGLVDLNGGTLDLGRDIELVGSAKISRLGNINGNSYALRLSKDSNALLAGDAMGPFVFTDLELHLGNDLNLETLLRFDGTSYIYGHGYTLDLNSTGTIQLASGATLYITDLTLKGIKGTNVVCLSDASSLILENVDWIQDGDAIFGVGALSFKKKVFMSGENTIFAYQSNQSNAILSKTKLKLDSNFTYSYDPIGITSKDLLLFDDVTSQLILKDATLHATMSGMNLKKGTLKLKGKSKLSSETTSGVDEGVTFGDGVLAANDFVCEFYPGSQLKILHGSLIYKNVNASSWKMPYSSAELYLDVGTKLSLYEMLNINQGFLWFGDNTMLEYVAEKTIVGSGGQLGTLTTSLIT